MSRATWLGLIALFLVLLPLSFVLHSTDPGIKGVLADVTFFGSILVGMFLIVSGARALARRYRQR